VREACDALEAILKGEARAGILDELTRVGTFGDGLRRLRAGMTANAFRTSSGTLSEDFSLAKVVHRLDQLTRQDGFHVLHAWDHQTHRFTEDIVPVLMLDFFVRADHPEPNQRLVLEILLDYYLLHLLALCAMRAWDDADADSILERVTQLVVELQGPDGSGHHFVDDAETLLIYALSQFHPEEQAYDRLISKVVTLDEVHQVTFARASAAVLSAHLRWGFWLMYERDVLRMRKDNVGDYPWLLNSVVTLLRSYARLIGEDTSTVERRGVVQALLLGLAADPWAFRGKAPAALADHSAEHQEVQDLLKQHGAQLLEDFEAHRPTRNSYSPLALHFNFPHNVLVAIVTLALLEGQPRALSLNTLLVEEPSDVSSDENQKDLALKLMAFSRGSPQRLGYQGAMLVAYDHFSGLRSFTMTVDTIRKSLH